MFNFLTLLGHYPQVILAGRKTNGNMGKFIAEDEYGIELSPWESLSAAQAVVLAVPHSCYLEKSVADFQAITAEGATLIDVKSILPRAALRATGLDVWRL